ncbi:hypothetical protein XELAEV_18040794mg, partial [Xenopus laevis]
HPVSLQTEEIAPTPSLSTEIIVLVYEQENAQKEGEGISKNTESSHVIPLVTGSDIQLKAEDNQEVEKKCPDSTESAHETSLATKSDVSLKAEDKETEEKESSGRSTESAHETSLATEKTEKKESSDRSTESAHETSLATRSDVPLKAEYKKAESSDSSSESNILHILKDSSRSLLELIGNLPSSRELTEEEDIKTSAECPAPLTVPETVPDTGDIVTLPGQEEPQPEMKESSDSTESNLVHTFIVSRENSDKVMDLSPELEDTKKEAVIESPECPVPTTPEEIVPAMSVGAGNILILQEVHSVETSDSLKDEPSAGVMNIIFVQEAKEPAVVIDYNISVPPVSTDVCPDTPLGTGQIEPLQEQKDQQIEGTQTKLLTVEKLTEADEAKGTESLKSDCHSVASVKKDPKPAALSKMDEIPKTPLAYAKPLKSEKHPRSILRKNIPLKVKTTTDQPKGAESLPLVKIPEKETGEMKEMVQKPKSPQVLPKQEKAPEKTSSGSVPRKDVPLIGKTLTKSSVRRLPTIKKDDRRPSVMDRRVEEPKAPLVHPKKVETGGTLISKPILPPIKKDDRKPMDQMAEEPKTPLVNPQKMEASGMPSIRSKLERKVPLHAKLPHPMKETESVKSYGRRLPPIKKDDRKPRVTDKVVEKPKSPLGLPKRVKSPVASPGSKVPLYGKTTDQLKGTEKARADSRTLPPLKKVDRRPSVMVPKPPAEPKLRKGQGRSPPLKRRKAADKAERPDSPKRTKEQTPVVPKTEADGLLIKPVQKDPSPCESIKVVETVKTPSVSSKPAKSQEMDQVQKALEAKCISSSESSNKSVHLVPSIKERTPFLVWNFQSFQTEHHVLLAMEFASGGDLASHLKKGPLPPERILFYGACIVLGVEFLHKHKIVHRDLKPHNILIDSTGYAKLADFGLCEKVVRRDGKIKGCCGTRNYLAPEMLTSEFYNESVDWWSVGVIMYKMVVGKLPFTGENKAALFDNIILQTPKYPPSLDVPTRILLERFLIKDGSNRLGGFTYGAKEVKQQEYFKTIDWEALAKKQVEAPFIPDPYEECTTVEPVMVVTPSRSKESISDDVQSEFDAFFKSIELK